MRDIHCPKDVGLKNTFSGEDCETEQYYNNCYHCWSTAFAKGKALEQKPSNNMVSREVFDQVMWERDVAIEQLKELGYGFGEKLRTAHWREDEKNMYTCSNCSYCFSIVPEDNSIKEYKYCPNCRCHMVDPQERSDKE